MLKKQEPFFQYGKKLLGLENTNLKYNLNLVMDSKQASENTFRQIMDLWVIPEIHRRQKSGMAKTPYKLHAAQVIFLPDQRPNQIRLNEEVRAIGKVKLKKEITKKKGELIYFDEIEGGYKTFILPEGEDPNCGHVTLYRLGDEWSIAFDFIYNKGLSKEHLTAADEFFHVANLALKTRTLRATIDNLFSAAELAARALLLTTPFPGENVKMTHGRVHSRYNREAHLGNIDAKHKNALNRLSDLRNAARYLHRPFKIEPEEISELMNAVQSAIDFSKSRVNSAKEPS